MQKLLILGGGTAGTMVANKLRGRLKDDDWQITVVDRDDEHHYQPGYSFVPFGAHRVAGWPRCGGWPWRTGRLRRPCCPGRR